MLRFIINPSKNRIFYRIQKCHSSFGKGHDIFENGRADILPNGRKRSQITEYGDRCFQVNDTLIRQSVILLPSSVYLWEPKRFSDITIESLSIFTLLYPTIEIVFIGCGDSLPSPLPRTLVDHYRARGICLEASSSANAAATFNVLNQEGRNIAAALLTIEPVDSVVLSVADEFK